MPACDRPSRAGSVEKGDVTARRVQDIPQLFHANKQSRLHRASSFTRYVNGRYCAVVENSTCHQPSVVQVGALSTRRTAAPASCSCFNNAVRYRVSRELTSGQHLKSHVSASGKSRASPSLFPVPRLSHFPSSMTLTPQPHFRRPREEVSKTSRTSRLSHFSQSRNTLPVFEIHYSTLKVQHSPCASKTSTTRASRQEPEGADNGSHIVMVNDPL